jgi:hypothetical protein
MEMETERSVLDRTFSTTPVSFLRTYKQTPIVPPLLIHTHRVFPYIASSSFHRSFHSIVASILSRLPLYRGFRHIVLSVTG